jgi:CRP/FNR family transcriptional regulator, cyclic AMP receptor protein
MGWLLVKNERRSHKIKGNDDARGGYVMSCGIILDPNTLTRLRDFSPLSAGQFKELAASLSVREVEKHTRICPPGTEREYAYILLSGSVACTCVDSRYGRRKLLKLISPGVIPILPEGEAAINLNLKYEAFTKCKIGQTDLDCFFRIVLRTGLFAYRSFLDLHLRHWMAVILRSSKSSLGLDTIERLGLALLELSSEFGVADSRGTFLQVVPRHNDLADLVGTTRSKVTHALADLERRGMITRFGRRIVVRRDRIEPFLRERPAPQPNPAAPRMVARRHPTLTVDT